MRKKRIKVIFPKSKNLGRRVWGLRGWRRGKRYWRIGSDGQPNTNALQQSYWDGVDCNRLLLFAFGSVCTSQDNIFKGGAMSKIGEVVTWSFILTTFYYPWLMLQWVKIWCHPTLWARLFLIESSFVVWNDTRTVATALCSMSHYEPRSYPRLSENEGSWWCSNNRELRSTNTLAQILKIEESYQTTNITIKQQH